MKPVPFFRRGRGVPFFFSFIHFCSFSVDKLLLRDLPFSTCLFGEGPYTHTPLSTLYTIMSTTLVSTTLQKSYDGVTGHKYINQYEMLNEIGRGVHGKVKLAQHVDTRSFVVG